MEPEMITTQTEMHNRSEIVAVQGSPRAPPRPVTVAVWAVNVDGNESFCVEQ